MDNFSEETFLKLLPLAKKYEIAGLVALCTARLAGKLSVTNVAEILSVADAMEVVPLKQQALRFIVSNADTLRAVQDTDGFEKLSKTLILEVLSASLPGNGVKRGH